MGTKQELFNTFNGESVKDEFEIQHSREILAGNFVWFFWGLIILLNLSMWPKIFFQQNFTIEALGLLLFLGLTITIEVRLKKYRAAQIEVDDPQSYKNMCKKLRHTSVYFGLAMMATMTVVNILLYFAFSVDQAFYEYLIRNSAITFVFAVISGFVIYFYSKKKLDRTYQDED
ncbi:hypothetical protein TP70_04315 [Staphylococcus microti]|nr:DUF6773 family protein [Staphylococcus microti]KIX91172.1 hypothetical protein TP70_04315 [Staphylococcus microti]PNZ75758.1 hypothetical protein CD132_11975 [Staphylococcus microti]